ncbi:cbb3-type cytochrome c oxidase subunit 3 [Neptunicoccus sediminis]|uniref:cbb3-type cytochrome c oxidase subunit 3 n=1 Tax=Neptunicoccus sediminis TaxID=1892596 RepID=UPI000845C3C9|nr:cbb3-type cytochrome c oxidase subunit 3 [Neptunicoccus sediminis]
MDTYSFLREMADSWFLLAMFCFFIGAILFLFRPGNRQMHKEASQIPLRDSQPFGAAYDTGNEPAPRGCAGDCPDCIKRTN